MSTPNATKGPELLGRMAGIVFGLALVGALVAPQNAAAQVAADDIPQYVGTWNLPLEAQGMAFEMVLTVEEGADGNAAASISSDMGDQPIETITLSGENLVLEYEINAQGMMAPVTLTLIPLEEEGQAIAEMDFADGQFFMETTATRE